MTNRLIATLVVVGASTSLLAAAATAANADPMPTPFPSPSHTWTPSPAPTHPGEQPAIFGVSVNPNPVVLRPHESQPVTVTVRGRDLRDVRISVGPGGSSYAPASSSSNSWESTTTIGWNDPTGTWSVQVSATGEDGKRYSASSSFTVRHEGDRDSYPKGSRDTRIAGFDATPEPVRKGRKLTLQGELQVDDGRYWSDWSSLDGQELGVYFLPRGSHRWQYVDTIETDSDGSFSTRIRAYKSGTWGVRFEGSGRLDGSEAYDYVRVKR